MHHLHPKVDEFFDKLTNWQNELTALRSIILECDLVEDFKWKVPCYTHNNKNIVLMHGFKEYCAIAFFKGALLQDTDGVLIQQTENVQNARQIRFSSTQEIKKMKSLMKAYIFEAIAIENIGVKVESKKVEELIWPAELYTIFKKNAAFQQAFEALTPGRQRGYHLFFTSAKQSKTIETRIENAIPRILKGKGLTDCICGLSKRMPNCDGSHKLLHDFKK